MGCLAEVWLVCKNEGFGHWASWNNHSKRWRSACLIMDESLTSTPSGEQFDSVSEETTRMIKKISYSSCNSHCHWKMGQTPPRKENGCWWCCRVCEEWLSEKAREWMGGVISSAFLLRTSVKAFPCTESPKYLMVCLNVDFELSENGSQKPLKAFVFLNHAMVPG